jgi:hypothetical protein
MIRFSLVIEEMHDNKYISTPPLDIRKSKNKMQILHDLKI